MTLPSASNKVKVGCRVELELISASGALEGLTVEIVADKFADYDSGLLGESTPLARAILGLPAGRNVPYRMGDLAAVHILSVTPVESQPDESAAVRRQKAAQKAAQEVDQTSAKVFAASFSGKWGDYDPSGVEHWDNPAQDDEQSPEEHKE